MKIPKAIMHHNESYTAVSVILNYALSHKSWPV